MKQTSDSAVRTRAAIRRPPMAVMEKKGSQARPDGAGEDSSRETRVHMAAYALYEARGCVDGHALEDWLAAEAAEAGKTDGSRPAAGDH
jgi:hypothetical protein